METAGQRREQEICPWVTLTTCAILATLVHVHCICHLGLVESGIRFPGINRICIEPVDSDKCPLGVKCSLSLYLLQNQENEPLFPEVITSEFSRLFPALSDTVNFQVWIGALLSCFTAFLFWKSPVLCQCYISAYQGVMGWKVYLLVATWRRSWLNPSCMLRYHTSV